MRRVVMGLAAVTAGYQTWGVYKIFHPSSNFKGGLEYLEAEAAKHPVQNAPPAELPVPDGIFRVRAVLPGQDILNYVRNTRSDVFYLNFHDFQLDQVSLYRYLVDKAAMPLDKSDITDDQGEEDLGSLLKHLSLKMIEKMTEHRVTMQRSSFSPQAWLQFFYERFYKPEELQAFYAARFPVVIVEGCEVWQELLNEKEGETEEEGAKRVEQMEVVLNFLKWLYVFRYHVHVVLLSTKPIDRVLIGFSRWYEEEVPKPQQAQRVPELIVRS